MKLLSLFQFTHPGKGATFLCHTLIIIMGCFNSRTLERVRLAVRERTTPGTGFNSRTLERVRHNDVRSYLSPESGFNSRTLERVRQ